MENCATSWPERIDEQLCFAVYTLSHAFTRVYRSALRETGLTYPRHLALMALSRLGQPTASTLVKELAMDFGTLTPMLKQLEREGLVARERTDADERVVRVRLTQAGTELAQRAQEAVAGVVAATGRSHESLSGTVAELLAIRRNLEAANGGSTQAQPERNTGRRSLPDSPDSDG
jgi:DNA-binding MarR family transcriptional regulator